MSPGVSWPGETRARCYLRPANVCNPELRAAENFGRSASRVAPCFSVVREPGVTGSRYDGRTAYRQPIYFI